MALQFSWAQDVSTLRTFGRPNQLIGSPPPATHKVHRLMKLTGRAVSTTPPVTGEFVHPGVLLGPAQLDFVKTKLAAGLNPWADGYAKMLAAKCDLPNSANNGRQFSSLSWVPTPRAQVGRGSSGSNSEGDDDLIADGIAAYAHALIWFYTGNRASAVKAIEIVNAWATTITLIKFDTTTYADGLLLAGWVGSMFPRSAEIMRYTFTPAGAEPALNVAAARNMFGNVIIPRVKDGWTGGAGNWLQSMAEAHMACAVFNDDIPAFNAALANWRGWTPGSFYLAGDVNKWPQLAGYPHSPAGTMYDRATTTPASMASYWRNPTPAVGSWPSGLQQETGRDPWHSAMAFAGAINAAETARLHGVDLYVEQRTRLVTAMEKNCQWLHQVYIDGVNPPSGWPFSASMQYSFTNTQRTTFEIGFNHYRNRLGIPMPYTESLLADYVRPSSYRATLMIAFETLTHYGAP